MLRRSSVVSYGWFGRYESNPHSFVHTLLPCSPFAFWSCISVSWPQRVLPLQLVFPAHRHATNSYTPFNAPLSSVLGPQWTRKSSNDQDDGNSLSTLLTSLSPILASVQKLCLNLSLCLPASSKCLAQKGRLKQNWGFYNQKGFPSCLFYAHGISCLDLFILMETPPLILLFVILLQLSYQILLYRAFPVVYQTQAAEVSLVLACKVKGGRKSSYYFFKHERDETCILGRPERKCQ